MATQQRSIGKAEAGRDAPAKVATFRPADDFDRDVWSVLGVPIDRMNTAEALAAIERATRDGKRLSFVTPNVNFLARATRDAGERRRILDADLSFVDGAPLVAIGRLLGMQSLSRCAGSDIFEALRKRPAFAGRRMRVFFFGGRVGAAEAAARALSTENRGLEAAGWLNPGYADIAAMSTQETIDTINRAAPDFLVVALGASKGQAWIDANQGRLKAPVVAHLGAVVDFTAGGVARAPGLVRRLGLEWAFRIAAEPSLWRRYWSDGVTLAGIAATKLASAILVGRRTGRKAAAAPTSEAGAVRIALSGDLCADDLDGVRAAFRVASRSAVHAILDFSAAGAIDAAFLGQTLMLEKALQRRGAKLLIAGASPSIRRILKAHSMAYSDAATAVAPALEPGDGGIAAVR